MNPLSIWSNYNIKYVIYVLMTLACCWRALHQSDSKILGYFRLTYYCFLDEYIYFIPLSYKYNKFNGACFGCCWQPIPCLSSNRTPLSYAIYCFMNCDIRWQILNWTWQDLAADGKQYALHVPPLLSNWYAIFAYASFLTTQFVVRKCRVFFFCAVSYENVVKCFVARAPTGTRTRTHTHIHKINTANWLLYNTVRIHFALDHPTST